MSAGLEELLRKAEKIPFQEIADSPTVRYYTNWKVFEQRLSLPDSTEYPGLPGWVRGLGDHTVVLGGRVESDYPYTKTLERGFNVAADMGVEGKMELYNTARLTAGVEVRVPKGVSEGRLVIVSLGGDGFTGHHIRVLVEESSEVELVLLDIARDPGVKVLTVKTIVSPRAKVRVYSLSLHGEAAVYTRRSYQLSRETALEVGIALSSGASTRLQEDYHLEGYAAGLEARASGVSLAGRWGDMVLNARHTGRESRGWIGGRGIALPGGLLALRGLAMVMPEAEWAATHVDVHVASLGEEGKAYASPMLEIHTGNVREAYHSASVSSLSEETLFYMATRGLGDEDAKAVFVDGVLAYSGVLDALGLTPKILLEEGQ